MKKLIFVLGFLCVVLGASAQKNNPIKFNFGIGTSILTPETLFLPSINLFASAKSGRLEISPEIFYKRAAGGYDMDEIWHNVNLNTLGIGVSISHVARFKPFDNEVLPMTGIYFLKNAKFGLVRNSEGVFQGIKISDGICLLEGVNFIHSKRVSFDINFGIIYFSSLKKFSGMAEVGVKYYLLNRW